MRAVKFVFSQQNSSQSSVSLCAATIAIWLVIVGMVLLAEGLNPVAELLLAVGLFLLFIVCIFRTYDPRNSASFAYDDQVSMGMELDHGNNSDSLEAPLLEDDLSNKELGARDD